MSWVYKNVGLVVTWIIMLFGFTINTTVLYIEINNHLDNDDVHLTRQEKTIVEGIRDAGFPFTEKDKMTLYELKRKLEDAHKSGRMMTPEEKRMLYHQDILQFKNVLSQLASSVSGLNQDFNELRDSLKEKDEAK